MDCEKAAKDIIKWLKDYVYGAGFKGVVFGLSGGLDSAVVAGLSVRAFGQDALGIFNPCYSDPLDAEHAELCARTFGLPFITVDIGETYDALCRVLGIDESTPRLLSANLKPRLRMIVWNYYAAKRKALVLGGTNYSEFVTGYFTKHGDTGVDLMPIGSLVKRHVRELAAYLGVPQLIIDKTPSAGLWSGQTDEDEMGITYDELDDFILTGEAESRVREIIDHMNKVSEHKRNYPLIPPGI